MCCAPIKLAEIKFDDVKREPLSRTKNNSNLCVNCKLINSGSYSLRASADFIRMIVTATVRMAVKRFHFHLHQQTMNLTGCCHLCPLSPLKACREILHALTHTHNVLSNFLYRFRNSLCFALFLSVSKTYWLPTSKCTRAHCIAIECCLWAEQLILDAVAYINCHIRWNSKWLCDNSTKRCKRIQTHHNPNSNATKKASRLN